MSELAELDPQDAASLLLAEHDRSWIAELALELDRALSGRQLERIMRMWDLTRTDLGQMFGVSRQAVSKWIADGVPADRIPQVADLMAISDVLSHYLKRERIPAVVRRSVPNLGGSSLLELVSGGQAAEALVLTRRMFTFTDVHG